LDKKNYFNLRTKITLLVCGVVALSLLVTFIFVIGKVGDITEKSMANKAADIAHIVAHSKLVIEALSSTRDEAEIQAFTNQIRELTNVDFIVVMDMNGIRKSHPNKTIVGEHFVGDDERAVLFEGSEYSSISQGTLGPSLRFFTPIYSLDGNQIGAVSVGILLEGVQGATDQSRSVVYWAILIGLMVGVSGAVYLSGNIKKTLFGLEPLAIAKLFEERNAMLESIKEGVIAVDRQARVTIINVEAIKLLSRAGIDDNPIGKDIETFLPNTRLKDVMQQRVAELDCEQNINGVTILTNRVPIFVNEEIVGAIATFRDKTEIRQLAEQLTGVRLYAEALRAQAHEFMNRMHVILGMVRLECYEQLADYINVIAKQYQHEVGSAARHIRDPVLAGFFMGKMSRAREIGVELILSEESFFPKLSDPEITHEMVTILGNLVNNAMEAVEHSKLKQVHVKLVCNDALLKLEVCDTGPGIANHCKEKIFIKGFSTRGNNRGLGLFLVQRSLQKLNGQIQVISELDKGTCFVVNIPWVEEGDQHD
jgi:CitB family two-component system sensor histidine kinase MalK